MNPGKKIFWNKKRAANYVASIVLLFNILATTVMFFVGFDFSDDKGNEAFEFIKASTIFCLGYLMKTDCGE